VATAGCVHDHRRRVTLELGLRGQDVGHGVVVGFDQEVRRSAGEASVA
jgi:hypothetical protein